MVGSALRPGNMNRTTPVPDLKASKELNASKEKEVVIFKMNRLGLLSLFLLQAFFFSVISFQLTFEAVRLVEHKATLL